MSESTAITVPPSPGPSPAIARQQDRLTFGAACAKYLENHLTPDLIKKAMDTLERGCESDNSRAATMSADRLLYWLRLLDAMSRESNKVSDIDTEADPGEVQKFVMISDRLKVELHQNLASAQKAIAESKKSNHNLIRPMAARVLPGHDDGDDNG